MQTFKKILISALCFFIGFIIVSSIVILPYLNSEANYYQDKNCRKNLSGTIDYVTIGASHCLCSFIPEILDNNLGCSSYNLAVSMMPTYAKIAMLKKEFSRNPIKTVVLEVSYDTLSRQETNEYGMGDEPMIAKMDNWKEKMQYLFNYVSLNDWLNVYSRSFSAGCSHWKDIIMRNNTSSVDYAAKGYHKRDSVDVTLNTDEIISQYNSVDFYSEFEPTNITQFKELINLCKEHDAKVIIAVVPVPEAMIWKYENLDYFSNYMHSICEGMDCDYYDFNLVKTRFSLFNDTESFNDIEHMSDTGARAFSKLFCTIINKVNNGENINDLYFPSYEDLKKDSSYMKIYNKYP